MEIEEINHRSCKRSRVVGNGKVEPQENYQDEDEDEDDGETKGEINDNNNTAGASNSNNNRMIRPWHLPSSRIIRVSRASGGKDRHSKVITAKGLRDRRVRLSVSTAIQFYDLQDRLGYDQPSKAIEWLIKAAASAIDELPSLDANFPKAPLDYHHHQQQLINIEQPMPSDSGMDPDADPSYNQQQHSSTSETSKGSVLSLSRSDSRVRARERAKERMMDRKKDRDDAHVVSHHQNVADTSLNSQGSFTMLLTGGSSSTAAAAAAAAVTVTAGQASASTANFIQKQMQNLPPVTSTADYFSTQSSLFGQQPLQQKGATTHQISTPGFSPQAHFGNSSPIGMVPLISGNAGDGLPGVEMQQFAFLQDHFFPVAAAAASRGDYNLNFSISPSLAGFHRGTLQSNSPTHNHQLHHQLSHHHHHHQVQAQRLSSALDGSSVPFFFGAAATAAAASPDENPYASGFDGHLQLCDGYKHLELKGKGKG